MTDPKNEHLQKQTLTIAVFAPDHPDRTTTPIFKHTRKLLIESNPAAKCWIDNEHCDKDNPLELHHSIVEWCDSTAVNWDMVKQLAPDFDWASFDENKPETFIDSPSNANLVLCKKHHVGLDHGIHMMPYPLWRLQKLKKKDFIFSPDEE